MYVCVRACVCVCVCVCACVCMCVINHYAGEGGIQDNRKQFSLFFIAIKVDNFAKKSTNFLRKSNGIKSGNISLFCEKGEGILKICTGYVYQKQDNNTISSSLLKSVFYSTRLLKRFCNKTVIV